MDIFLAILGLAILILMMCSDKAERFTQTGGGNVPFVIWDTIVEAFWDIIDKLREFPLTR